MTEQEFLKVGSAFLDDLFETIEKTETDLIADMADNALLLENKQGAQYFIHLHRVLREIWISSPFSGAHHFKWEEQKKTWVSTRDSSQYIQEFIQKDIRSWLGKGD